MEGGWVEWEIRVKIGYKVVVGVVLEMRVYRFVCCVFSILFVFLESGLVCVSNCFLEDLEVGSESSL